MIKIGSEIQRRLGATSQISMKFRWDSNSETGFALSAADLAHFFSQMAEDVMSDEKQEVYRGLRDLLHLLEIERG